MKRSEAISIIEQEGPMGIVDGYSEDILKALETAGMKPPGVKAEVVKGKDYLFGTCCTMRCDCEDCNPNFLMHVWEKE